MGQSIAGTVGAYPDVWWKRSGNHLVFALKFSIFFVLIVVLCICQAINSQRKTKSNLWYGSVRVVPDKLQLVC